MATAKEQEEAARRAAEEHKQGGVGQAVQPARVAEPPGEEGPDRVPGHYIVGGKPGRDGKHYGGRVVDHEGKVLATFDDKQVNTGRAEDGKKLAG